MDIEETIEAELEAKSIEKDNISLEINDDPHRMTNLKKLKRLDHKHR